MSTIIRCENELFKQTKKKKSEDRQELSSHHYLKCTMHVSSRSVKERGEWIEKTVLGLVAEHDGASNSVTQYVQVENSAQRCEMSTRKQSR